MSWGRCFYWQGRATQLMLGDEQRIRERLHAVHVRFYSTHTDSSPRHISILSQFLTCWQSSQDPVGHREATTLL
jgi:hypothetical protein